MAEIILKVGSGSNYSDGDCLCVMNRRRTLYTHAQSLCHVKFANRNAGGNIRLATTAYDMLNLTKQYRFERVSQTELKRITLATMSEEILSGTPNAKGEAIDVDLFVQRRKKRTLHYMFGVDGAEIWFGGSTETSMAVVGTVWDAIETRTPRQRNQPRFRQWPMGYLDIRSHLPIRIENLNEAEVNRFLRPSYVKRPNGNFRWEREDPANPDTPFVTWSAINPDEGGPLEGKWEKVIRRKRRHRIRWRNMLADLGESEANILNKRYPVGEEIDEDGRTGYRSKTQNDQLKSRVDDQGDTE